MHIDKTGSYYLVIIDKGQRIATIDLSGGQYFISFKNSIEIQQASAAMDLIHKYKRQPWL